jgi:RNA polymerase sigma-70 factor (ECF subfamily)
MDRAAPFDEDLLAAIARGQLEALGDLFDRHGRLALALAYRLCGDWDLAEEAVQEAFLTVWRFAASHDRPRHGARVWLLRTVYGRAHLPAVPPQKGDFL